MSKGYTFSMKFQQTVYQLRKFYRNAWPINWSNIKKTDLVISSIKNSNYGTKMILFVSLIGVVFSFLFSSLGTFEVMTKRIEAKGGDFYEGLVGARLNKFNPVLNSSESEKKITSLLYHPLYRVEYSDFLTNPEKKPKITPILLTEEPSWSANPNNSEDKFYVLNFELRDDIYWSNGEPITNRDVQYSFARIKEEGGNSDFRGIFENYNIEIVPGSETKFRILPNSSSILSNPQLIYMANFSPISKQFYTNPDGREMNNQELQTHVNSREVTVTSGFFTVPSRVEDPQTSNMVSNPRWSNIINGYDQVVLEVNPKQNYGNIFLERYIFNVYENIQDTGGDTNLSLERSVKENRLDLFTRSLLSAGQRKPTEIQEILGLNQKTQSNNIFLSLFYNVAVSSNGFLINPYLRHYISCHFQEENLTERFQDRLQTIPANRRSIPLHFNQEFTLDCTDVDGLILNYRNESGTQVYTIDEDTRGGIRRVKIFNNTQTLTLLSLEEFSEQADWVRDIMTKAGLPMEARYVSSNQLSQEIESGNYHIALLPFATSSADPYPIYGFSGQNFSKVSSSRNRTATDKIENGLEFEQILEAYSRSSLQDTEAREKLIDFFKNQQISVNLFRTKREFNYSQRIKNLGQSFDNFLAFPYHLYYQLPNWYIETKRQFIFS